MCAAGEAVGVSERARAEVKRGLFALALSFCLPFAIMRAFTTLVVAAIILTLASTHAAPAARGPPTRFTLRGDPLPDDDAPLLPPRPLRGQHHARTHTSGWAAAGRQPPPSAPWWVVVAAAPRGVMRFEGVSSVNGRVTVRDSGRYRVSVV